MSVLAEILAQHSVDPAVAAAIVAAVNTHNASGTAHPAYKNAITLAGQNAALAVQIAQAAAAAANTSERPLLDVDGPFTATELLSYCEAVNGVTKTLQLGSVGACIVFLPVGGSFSILAKAGITLNGQALTVDTLFTWVHTLEVQAIGLMNSGTAANVWRVNPGSAA